MKYHIGKDGRQLGPYDAAQVRELLASGAVSYDDLVWRDGMTDWAPLRVEFPPRVPPPVPPSGTIAGNPFLSAAPQAAVPTAPLRLAARETRLLARLIDTGLALLAFAPGMVWFFASVAAVSSGNGLSSVEATEMETDAASTAAANLGGAILLTVLLALALLLVQTILLSTRGQTLGKKLLGIRVVRTNGTEAGFAHAVLLRAVVMGIINGFAGVTALIDPLLIFREDRRCLHDLVADTKVVSC